MEEVTGGSIYLSTLWFPTTLRITAVSSIKTNYEIKFSLNALAAYDAPRYEIFYPDVPLVAVPSFQPEDSDLSVRRSTSSPENSVSGIFSRAMIAIFDSSDVAFMVLGRAPSQTDAFERLGIFKF